MDLCSVASSPMLTLTEALTRITLAIKPIEDSESVTLKKALGRVLDKPVFAAINLPYDRNAAMDGYAFNSGAMGIEPFTLKLVGTSWAGRPYTGRLNADECIRIFTGAVVPEQADTVIMQEQVQVDADNIHFPGALTAGQNVRHIGEDVKQNQLLVEQGKKLTAMDLGFLAAAGVDYVTVKKPLKIIFFSTGDELTPLGTPLTTGKIYDSNRYLLSGLLADTLYEVTDGGVLADDPNLLEEALTAASKNFHVIITTGGASVGEADYINTVLARCGQVDFWKVAIKPGKPLAFGTIGASYFFGLPGNPAAVLTTFQQLVVPALRQFCGAHPKKPLRFYVKCTSNLKKSPGRQEFQRGILTEEENGELTVSAYHHQGSHLLSNLASTNCYIILPSECSGVSAGESVLVEPFEVQF